MLYTEVKNVISDSLVDCHVLSKVILNLYWNTLYYTVTKNKFIFHIIFRGSVGVVVRGGVFAGTSIGNALKLTVCSEPRQSSRPQWKRNSARSYSWSGGRGPPWMASNNVT